MAQIETWIRTDIKKPVDVQVLNGNVFSADNMANLIGVEVYDNGEPYTLSGTVTASIIRGDGGTVTASGSFSGNKASVVLPAAAYVYPGIITVVIKVTSGSVVTTIGTVVATVYRSSTDTIVDPGTVIPNIEELIAEIEAAVASIPADYSSLWTTLAPAYSSSATYAVGQYVTYNGALYKCTTAVTTAGSWSTNSSKFTAVNFGNDLYKFWLDVTNTKKALKEVYNGGIDIGALIPDTYIQSSNGAQATWNGTSATDFIVCYPAKKLITSINLITAHTYAENAFYTIDKTFISSFLVAAGTNELTVPTNAYYVRFSNKTENMATFSVRYNTRDVMRTAKIGAAMIVPSSNMYPSFTKSGTTITFLCSNNIGAKYIEEECKFASTYVPMSASIDVPHDSWCIWNITTNTIVSITDSNLRALDSTDYAVLFYNNNGFVRGPYEQYMMYEKYDPLHWKSNCIVAPYGTYNTYPFSVENNGTSIVITCERYIVYNDSDQSWRMCNMLENPVVTVPHDSFCVYNNTTNAIEVKTDSQLAAMTDKYYMLFYNSSGKMCGPFEAYRNRYDISVIKSNMPAGYPSYYNAHVKSKIQAIDLKLAALTSGDAFVFITDIHYPYNQMHSPALVQDVCNKSGIDMVVLNGDYINKENDGKSEALLQINRVCSLYNYANINTYRVVGNHEFNNPGASDDPADLAKELSAAELRWSFLNSINDKVVCDTSTVSYYFDNTKQKIRYFVGQVTRSSGTNADSIKWVAKQVESVPDDYGVVIFWHTFLSASGGTVHPVNDHFANILNAMKAKTQYDYLGFQLDYRNKSFEFIACFCGDYHLDMNYTTTDGAVIIGTTTDSTDQTDSLPRTVGTYNEQAFDVVVINRTTKKINCTRIGAGSDREFTYST